YLPSLQVNFQHYDWTHRHISASLTSLAAFGRLFVTPQPDGMYRPLTFISLWADYRLFGDQLWGYHLQGIALHMLNAALVGVLAVRLGMARPAGRLAALVFGVASIHFEAVVWPAARFDLLATTFTCLALIFFLRFWRAEGVRLGHASICLLSFTAAVLNKETAYSAVLVIAALVATHRLWKLESSGRSKSLVLFAALIACAGALLTLRWALFSGIGGYGSAPISAKSCYLLVVNTLTLSVFGINASAPPSVWRAVTVTGFVCVILGISFAYPGSRDRRKWALVLFALLSAVPAVNVIGWIQPSLMHSRHVYWPSVWTTLLFVLLAGRRCPAVLMSLFLLVQAAALTYNISAWRNVIATADNLAQQIAHDTRTAQVAKPGIVLLGVPEHLDGVLYFGPELESRIRRSIAGATVERSLPEHSPAFAYRWDSASRSLIRDSSPLQ
ncbi:MAG TPA: hypothetical protein VN428_16655, partial [Bryobacteraceae bacterium]|nr:hypothetical protein [Bryobacteraceae bacterium]